MVRYECYVDGLDPWTRLILSIFLLIIVLPMVVFCVTWLGKLAVQAWKEGNVPMLFLHITFIAMSIFLLFAVVVHLMLAILCLIS